MNENTTILVCCHKKDYWREEQGLFPIQVGKAIADIDLNIPGDDTGDNISNLNPYFCELTALYWLWKNGNIKKYVGLNHYRRYFDFSKNHTYGEMNNTITEEALRKRENILPDLDIIMKKYDIILPTAMKNPFSIKDEYIYWHIKEDYEILKRVVMDLYPDYINSFEAVLEKGRTLRPFNMFITHYNIFDNYSKWLFDILFEVRKRIKISSYTNQARVFGYMGERLLNVYVYQHNLRIKKVPVMLVSDKSNYPVVLRWIKWIRYKMLFCLFCGCSLKKKIK